MAHAWVDVTYLETVDEMAHAWVDVTYLEQEEYDRLVAERLERRRVTRAAHD